MLPTLGGYAAGPFGPARCSAHLFGSPARSSASRWDRYPPPDARSCRKLPVEEVATALGVEQIARRTLTHIEGIRPHHACAQHDAPVERGEQRVEHELVGRRIDDRER